MCDVAVGRLAEGAPGHRVPEDAVNTIAGKADFLRRVVVRDRTVNGNSIPDIVMVKDTEDGDVVLFLVTALAYIEKRQRGRL